jgi:GT2 family glycosyltransferase/glycosyltransferase involved in cell wall biosynthesis
LKPKIKVAFASGTEELNRRLVGRMRELFPELPLYVVSDFPPEDADAVWVPYRVNRSLGENLARCRAAFRGKRIRLAGVMLVPGVPFRRMRLMAVALAPLSWVAFNENLNDFMPRPRCLPAIVRHLAWRAKNLLRWGIGAARKADWRLAAWYAAGRAAGWLRIGPENPHRQECPCHVPGISVVIPSRNGRHLLAAQLPGLVRELDGFAAEIVVADNGSDDGTAAWLVGAYPQVRVDVSAEPLSFAAAVNRGIRLAAYSHVCLLNNDMLLDSGFFAALVDAFDRVPDLFCASAQIRFPEGVRREETGKTVFAQAAAADFPIRCDEPLAGEDLSYVLYGSGGCSLYDAGKLAALGGVDEAYAPAYVEDLDLGYRAWQRGWPSVYVAGAVVEHRHRATTSRYYTEVQLDAILEANYLKFLWRAVADGRLFRRLWRQALNRLRARGTRVPLPVPGLRRRTEPRPEGAAGPEELILALNSGAVAVFPGRPASGKPRVLVACPYVPFPLSHGGAVRVYNLMRRAAESFDQVLVAFTDRLEPPPPEMLAICCEVVVVHRAGSHSLPFKGLPDVVEEFASPAYRSALLQTVRKWQPAIAQLELTQMAQYAADCAPARTILVEHDITFDLYGQMLELEDDWELRRQYALWRRFENAAWGQVSRVVTMSEKDTKLVTAGARTIPNGVDLERFRPAAGEPEPRRLLFIGSFAHLPNLLALEFFLNHVWPRLDGVRLHVIAGARHEFFLARSRVRLDLERPGVEVEGFVADPRPAYERAAVVVAPLVASAGTNIKILEAMAMGKAVVSTPAGVNGLDDLAAGEDFRLTRTPGEMAETIEDLLGNPEKRRALESAARRRVEREFGWDVIAGRQARLYRELL